MSYAMTHLLIADRYLDNNPVENRELFMLGSIAPDAVHSRPDFTKRIKARSHCLQEEENWGEIYTEEPLIKWYEMLRNFWRETSSLATDSDSMSFLKGYTLHILTDIYNNARFYGPCRIKFGLDSVDDFREAYRAECILQDNWIWNGNPKLKDIAHTLSDTTEKYDLAGLLSKLNIDKHFSADDLKGSIAHLLKKQTKYVSVSLEGLSMVSESGTEHFISDVESECEKMLFDMPDAGRKFRILEL